MSSLNSSLSTIQNNTNSVYFQNAQKNLGNSKINREGFIRLILAQLQYQDPTKPQDNTQMLTQQLQLEQADQMQNMVNSSTFSQATNMIGKTVSLTDSPWNFDQGVSETPEWDAETNSSKQLTGEVQGVQFDPSKNKALLLIDGKYYDSSLVRNITNPTTASAQ